MVKKILCKAKQELAYYRALFTHPQTPRVSRWLLGGAVAYLVSPIDIIPDFIPLVGQLDDILIVPGLVFFALAFIPENVKVECRKRTASHISKGATQTRAAQNAEP